MKPGNHLLSEILPQLDGHEAYVRATLSRDESGWVVRRIDAVVGKMPYGWNESSWVYETIALLKITLDGFTLSRAFREALSQEMQISIGEIEAKMPKLRAQTFGQWRPSMARRTSGHLLWPTDDWSIMSENSTDTSWYVTGFLAADGCPTFVSLQEALHAFHTGNFSTGVSLTPSDLGLIQIVKVHAWIHKVKVGTTAVDVWIRGESIRDTIVQLIDSVGYKNKKVGSTGHVRLRYSKNLADDARLFLTEGSECLDYRVLGFQHPYSEDSRHSVEYEITEDPESEITRLITQGEGSMLEYKKELPATADATRKVMRTVVAFANGNGGEIVFGMDPDEVTIVGLAEGDQVRERDRLTNMARDHVTPGPVTETRFYEYDGKTLIVMSVAPGNQPPYGRAGNGKAVEYFIRRGANTYPARPDEVREAVLSRFTRIES